MAAFLSQLSSWEYILHESTRSSCTEGIVKLRVGGGSILGAKSSESGAAHQVKPKTPCFMVNMMKMHSAIAGEMIVVSAVGLSCLVFASI
jgi:hypothetical protein